MNRKHPVSYRSVNKTTISILFIGNSFSYYNALPMLVADFAYAGCGRRVFVDQVVRGGATLRILGSRAGAFEKICARHWDYVVLQERGRLGGRVGRGVPHVGNTNAFFAIAERFDRAIKNSNARTVLYCPPAFLGQGLQSDAERLSSAYLRLAKRLRAMLIPSVTAFALASRERPDLKLYNRDRHHPNPLGSYLIASLFYATIFRKTASRLPGVSYQLRSQKRQQTIRKVLISKSDREFLWSMARRCTTERVIWNPKVAPASRVMRAEVRTALTQL